MTLQSQNHLSSFLLVEDDDAHAKIIARTLRNERIANKMERVRDGEQALAYLRQEGEYANAERPSIVLLDLKLPRVNGLDVLAAIKNDENLRTIPVVILTTSDSEKDRLRAYHSHVNSYLVKPVDAACFRDMVKELNLYWGVYNRV